eukprot:14763200-Ditylum_brightwellii.AAC.1
MDETGDSLGLVTASNIIMNSCLVVLPLNEESAPGGTTMRDESKVYPLCAQDIHSFLQCYYPSLHCQEQHILPPSIL